MNSFLSFLTDVRNCKIASIIFMKINTCFIKCYYIFKASFFGAQLPIRLSELWDLILPNVLKDTNAISIKQENIKEEEANQLIFNLQVLEVMAPSLDSSLLPPILECLPSLCNLLTHSYKAVRHMASRCIAILTMLDTKKVTFNGYFTFFIYMYYINSNIYYT